MGCFNTKQARPTRINGEGRRNANKRRKSHQTVWIGLRRVEMQHSRHCVEEITEFSTTQGNVPKLFSPSHPCVRHGQVNQRIASSFLVAAAGRPATRRASWRPFTPFLHSRRGNSGKHSVSRKGACGKGETQRATGTGRDTQREKERHTEIET